MARRTDAGFVWTRDYETVELNLISFKVTLTRDEIMTLSREGGPLPLMETTVDAFAPLGHVFEPFENGTLVLSSDRKTVYIRRISPKTGLIEEYRADKMAIVNALMTSHGDPEEHYSIYRWAQSWSTAPP